MAIVLKDNLNNTVQYSTLQYSTIYNTIQYNTIQYMGVGSGCTSEVTLHTVVAYTRQRVLSVACSVTLQRS